jgi:predicted peroxiredoxin
MLTIIGLAAMPASINQPTVVAGQAAAVKARILVHVTHGPEQPTRAALAFLVAKSALDEGHSVTLFLAGDAVQLIRDPVLDNLAGLGTGRLRELYDAIVKGGGRFYLSGMSSNARGVTEVDLKGKPAEFAQPATLVRLSLAHDRMFTY